MAGFPDRLKELRQEKNMTLSKLGKEVGLTNATISRYESGLRKPNQDVLEELANFFEVTTDYLLGRTNQKYFKEEDTIAFHTKKKITDKDLKTLKTIVDAYIDGLDDEEK